MDIISTKIRINEAKLAQQIHDLSIDIPFSIRLPNSSILQFGAGDSVFVLTINDQKALSAIMRFDELRFTEAYINGSINIEGDMWGVINCREVLRDRHPLHYFGRRLLPLFTGQLYTNKHAISDHYEYDNEFFLKFLDSSRCYSQAIFEHDEELLETAQSRKLDTIIKGCRLKPGDRVLDVGGGWGAFVEYAGKKGINVTALTLAKKSEKYLGDLIQRLQIPCDVKYIDFYEYVDSKQYDAIVILGVMEHLPNYFAVLKQLQRLLRPGGRVYLDASSYREKYSKPTYISRYVFPGNHRYFCLHEFLRHLSKTDLELKSVYNDRYSYYLTCKEWAKNLESERVEIIKRWGERLYRVFHLYLWGSAHSFFIQNMDAYRVILEKPVNRY